MKKLTISKDGKPLAGVWVVCTIKGPDGKEITVKALTDKDGNPQIDIDKLVGELQE